MENNINKKGRKRELQGEVVSNKMTKTVRVRVDSVVRHPLYQKVQTRNKVFFAHTEKDLNIGDKVVIRESKPYSKNVKWVVVEKNDDTKTK
ncbi:MAG: 30S ribosomal protein S17 [candidate division WS6 bacterium GW2011_GWF1_35_23]|uniref:Small ribosomal subunit protein uS17 n=1 Tax=candidate division WS6 bacterium GW2011_GWF1_35_23 TaxID=1619097 RepID=A0A0G0FF73_9BACT|nr:MAG: 30S ribosomal protein S17 [candidate division WS6 bacterium GW2011_GWF1_35_23]